MKLFSNSNSIFHLKTIFFFKVFLQFNKGKENDNKKFPWEKLEKRMQKIVTYSISVFSILYCEKFHMYQSHLLSFLNFYFFVAVKLQ